MPFRQRNWLSVGGQFVSENWFAAGCQFVSENWFTAANSISAANHNFAVKHTIWQRMLIRFKQLSFGSKSQFRC
jgi:poly(3-hydroxyalkanoate) synthetase